MDKNNSLTTVKVVPLSPALAARVADIPTPDISTEQAVAALSDMLGGVDSREVKVNQGRAKYDEIEDYLREMPEVLIVRVAEAALLAVQGERWSRVLDGKGFTLLTWVRHRYPICEILWQRVEFLRGEARAARALDKLDVISEEAEQDGAKVKALELTLRAHHPAFGAKTAQKQVSDRPVVVVNIAQIFGAEDENRTKTVVDAGE